MSSSGHPISRRAFLLGGWSWFPLVRLFRRRTVTLDGVRFRVVRHGRGDRSYLLIHGDEETARAVLLAHMKTHQGIAHVVTNHTRDVDIDHGRLDPNRMFSRAGAEANLKLLNPDWTAARLAAVLDRLDRGRPKLASALLPPRGGLVVALHNNTPGYSLDDEAPISDAVWRPQPEDPHAFFLCTAPADFAILRQSPYNVALQNRAPKTDDGSLSRLCARLGVRYVNLEAGRGKFDQQRRMLDWLDARVR